MKDAMAFLAAQFEGRLIENENEALRGNDPSSRFINLIMSTLVTVVALLLVKLELKHVYCAIIPTTFTCTLG